MRLVDGDALIAKQASIAKTFARSDAQKSLMGRVMYNTENAPTIDAIPVEWLDEKFMDIQNKDIVLSRAAWLVLHAWQEEQEAR